MIICNYKVQPSTSEYSWEGGYKLEKEHILVSEGWARSRYTIGGERKVFIGAKAMPASQQKSFGIAYANCRLPGIAQDRGKNSNRSSSSIFKFHNRK